jgi:hypothetical protein
MTEQLIAFHGDANVKDKYMKRLEAHKAADEIIKGLYWKDGKGCAVGCTVHSGNHANYETELGIPRILARLEDGIFESLQNGRAKEWPIQFLSAINVGADLSNVWPQFAVWMLVDETWGVLHFARKEKTKEAIVAIAKFYQEGKFAKKEYYSEIRKLRTSAAASAASAAAASAADAASYAAAAAASAADAADAADAASDAAAAAASAAAAAASAADAASAAYADARNKWREAQADKLLELLRNAPILVMA